MDLVITKSWIPVYCENTYETQNMRRVRKLYIDIYTKRGQKENNYEQLGLQLSLQNLYILQTQTNPNL